MYYYIFFFPHTYRYASHSWDTVAEENFCKTMTGHSGKVNKQYVHEGHLYFINCPNQEPDHKISWINVVREPIERFISMYNYIRRSTRFKGQHIPEKVGTRYAYVFPFLKNVFYEAIFN